MVKVQRQACWRRQEVAEVQRSQVMKVKGMQRTPAPSRYAWTYYPLRLGWEEWVGYRIAEHSW